MTSALMNEKKAAELLNVSVSALRKWRNQGRGPRYLKPNGTSVKYRAEDIEAWLASCPSGGQGLRNERAV